MRDKEVKLSNDAYLRYLETLFKLAIKKSKLNGLSHIEIPIDSAEELADKFKAIAKDIE